MILVSKLHSQNWQQLPNFPSGGRDDGSVFVIGNNVYCGLGAAVSTGISSDFYRFNPLNDTWATYTVASLPAIGRQYCMAFSYANYGYIIGGVDANWQTSNMVWRYDTMTNNWIQKTSIPDSVQGAVCFFINNKAYIAGGRDKNNICTSKVWEYDIINDTWQQKNNMPNNGRWRASGAVINNKGYLILGADSLNRFSKDLFEYNPVNDAWVLIDSFPNKGRNYASAFNINNKLVVALGIDTANIVYNDCYSFDISTHQWQNQTPLPSFDRKGCMAFSFNNSAYITAGIDGMSNRLVETWKGNNITGIETLGSIFQDIIIYPNPNEGVLTVNYSISDPTGKDATLRLIEMGTGRVLISKTVSCNTTQSVIDLNEFANGVYSLSIQSNANAPITIRVVKVR